MADEAPTFLGMPLKFSTKNERKEAVMHGDFVHRGGGMAFYQRGQKIYVVEADKPAGHKDESQ